MITKNSYERFITGLAITFVAILIAFGIVFLSRASVTPLPERITVGGGIIQAGDRGKGWGRETWQ